MWKINNLEKKLAHGVSYSARNAANTVAVS